MLRLVALFLFLCPMYVSAQGTSGRLRSAEIDHRTWSAARAPGEKVELPEKVRKPLMGLLEKNKADFVMVVSVSISGSMDALGSSKPKFYGAWAESEGGGKAIHSKQKMIYQADKRYWVVYGFRLPRGASREGVYRLQYKVDVAHSDGVPMVSSPVTVDMRQVMGCVVRYDTYDHYGVDGVMSMADLLGVHAQEAPETVVAAGGGEEFAAAAIAVEPAARVEPKPEPKPAPKPEPVYTKFKILAEKELFEIEGMALVLADGTRLKGKHDVDFNPNGGMDHVFTFKIPDTSPLKTLEVDQSLLSVQGVQPDQTVLRLTQGMLATGRVK